MNNMLKQRMLLALVVGFLSCAVSYAQTFVRYMDPDDIGTKAMYADSVLNTIRLPHGVAKLSSYPKLNVAALELMQVLQDPSKELIQVWVSGSTSPDGLWADNVRLSQQRVDAAAAYIQSILDLPEYKIHKESLVEDWDRLADLVAASDMPYKYEVLYIIRTKEWGARKTALQKLDGGKAWKMLEKDFFPDLRCVRFVIYCTGKSPETIAAAPVQERDEKVVMAKADTVYVTDTVYVVKNIVQVAEETPVVTKTDAYETYRQESLNKNSKLYDTPWMMGFKTNLIADAMAVPYVGVEFQIGRRLSLDIQGWATDYNIFCPEDSNALVYGVAPELRWWLGDRTMQRGSFFGLHGRCMWYTMQWTDGFLYQNGKDNMFDKDAGNSAPAWSAGITYGYSLGFGRKANWGMEFVVGVGYGRYLQNRAAMNEESGKWTFYDFQANNHFGITHVGINLTYRFSLRKVNPEYYDK